MSQCSWAHTSIRTTGQSQGPLSILQASAIWLSSPTRPSCPSWLSPLAACSFSVCTHPPCCPELLSLLPAWQIQAPPPRVSFCTQIIHRVGLGHQARGLILRKVPGNVFPRLKASLRWLNAEGTQLANLFLCETFHGTWITTKHFHPCEPPKCLYRKNKEFQCKLLYREWINNKELHSISYDKP